MAARKQTAKVEQSPAQLVEIRVDGRVKFKNDCWDVQLDQEGSLLKLAAATHPTMVSVVLAPPERFGDDPRDGEEPILQVHSGRRTPTKKAATKKEE